MDPSRWAARCEFLEPVWRGRPRLLVDSVLDRVLRAPMTVATGASVAHDLVAALMEGPGIQMLTRASPSERAALSEKFPQISFFSPVELSERLRASSWELAMLEASELLDLARFLIPRDEAGDPGEPRDRLVELRQLFDVLAARGLGERSLVFTFPAAETTTAWPLRLAYEDVADLFEQSFGLGAIFGLFTPHIHAAASFERIDAAADADAGARGSERADEPGLVFDNRLGAETPRFFEFIVAHGTDAEFGQGLTLIEIDAPMVREPAHLPVAAEADAGPSSVTARLDKRVARDQHVRWLLARTRAELGLARQVAPTILEAELAATRARLHAPDAPDLSQGPDVDVPATVRAGTSEADEREAASRRARSFGLEEASRGDLRSSLLHRLDRLVGRVDGGAIEPRELRQELDSLRGGLRRLSSRPG